MGKKTNTRAGLFRSVNTLARIVTSMAEEELKGTELSPSAALILLELNSVQEIAIGSLSEKLGLSPSTLTRMCESLEKKSFLKRTQKGRSVILESTPKGKLLNEKIEGAFINFDDRCNLLVGRKSAAKLVKKIHGAVSDLS